MKKEKFLLVKEVAQLLSVPLITVQRWIHQGKIPYKLKKGEYLLKRDEITAWAQSHQILINEPKKEETTEPEETSIFLHRSVELGGVYDNLEGNDIYSVLKNAVSRIQFPYQVDKTKILNELIDREEIASTGIGKGVAIPHPRKPILKEFKYPIVPVFKLENPVDFNSVDGEPVFILFLILSSSTPIHLKILSKLSFCLRNPDFFVLLSGKILKEELLKQIMRIENSFISDT